jgi:hypothetical protein
MNVAVAAYDVKQETFVPYLAQGSNEEEHHGRQDRTCEAKDV